MYEDFYPYIPGSLDAKQRKRKMRLKGLCYGFGAIIVFSCGFLLGLAWYESDSAMHQTAVYAHRPPETVKTASVKRDMTAAESKVSKIASLSIPRPETKARVPLDVDMYADVDTEIAIDAERNLGIATHSPLKEVKPLTDTDVAPLSSVALGPDTAAAPSDQPVPPPADIRTAATSRPNISKAKKSISPLRPYLVQVGAFRNQANARGIVAKLRTKGYQPFIRTVHDGQNRALYRVFLDHAQDKAQAQATAKAFEETEKMDALVMLADNLSQPNRRTAATR